MWLFRSWPSQVCCRIRKKLLTLCRFLLTAIFLVLIVALFFLLAPKAFSCQSWGKTALAQAGDLAKSGSTARSPCTHRSLFHLQLKCFPNVSFCAAWQHHMCFRTIIMTNNCKNPPKLHLTRTVMFYFIIAVEWKLGVWASLSLGWGASGSDWVTPQAWHDSNSELSAPIAVWNVSRLLSGMFHPSTTITCTLGCFSQWKEKGTHLKQRTHSHKMALTLPAIPNGFTFPNIHLLRISFPFRHLHLQIPKKWQSPTVFSTRKWSVRWCDSAIRRIWKPSVISNSLLELEVKYFMSRIVSLSNCSHETCVITSLCCKGRTRYSINS